MAIKDVEEVLQLAELLIDGLPEPEQKRIADQLRGFVIGFVLSKPKGEDVIKEAYKKLDRET